MEEVSFSAFGGEAAGVVVVVEVFGLDLFAADDGDGGSFYPVAEWFDEVGAEGDAVALGVVVEASVGVDV